MPKGLAVVACGLACGQPPTDTYLIGDPQGDWRFPSPFAHLRLRLASPFSGLGGGMGGGQEPRTKKSLALTP
jgi:hypothetical protein